MIVIPNLLDKSIINNLMNSIRWQYTYLCDSIFAGHTTDYGTMVEHLEEKYPSTYIVAVGFSLGGNIVTKYMGENEKTLSQNVIGGISICQGYNAVEYV